MYKITKSNNIRITMMISLKMRLRRKSKARERSLRMLWEIAVGEDLV
jgi:hypothetical protein